MPLEAAGTKPGGLPAPQVAHFWDAAGNLLRLAALTDEKHYLDKAVRTAAWLGGRQRETPELMPYMLRQWPRLLAQAHGGRDGKSP